VFASSTILSSAITETHYDLARPIGTYFYEVRAKDDDGQWGYWSQRETVTETGAGVPASAADAAFSFTNPVHVGGRVVFSAPALKSGVISVFDVTGRLVESLEVGASGEAAWDLSAGRAKHVTSGIYFVEFAGAGKSVRAKLVVLK
jgi:chitodextrinase